MARISHKKREKALDTVLTRFGTAEQFQKPLFNNFVDYYRIYRSVRERRKQNYKGRSNLFIPYVYANVENAFPKMIASKPRLNVLPREKGDMLNAEVLEKVLDYQWYDLDMKNMLKDWVKQGLIYGMSPLKVTWEFNEDSGRDDLTMTVIPVFDFYIDPDATNVRDARYCIHRLWKNAEELRKDPKYKLPSSLINQPKQYNEYETQIDAVKNQSKGRDATNELIELHEYWGLFDLNGDGIEEQVLIVVANKSYVIRIEPNPYSHGQKPFVAFHDVKVPNEFWSIGEIEPAVSLQYELNDIRNQRMDNVTQILKSSPIISRQSNIRPYDVQNWQNGDVLQVDGPPQGAVDFARPPDVTSSSYNEETLIKSDLQFVSSLSDLTPIVGAKRTRALAQQTATGASIQREENNARFRAKLDNLEDSLTELGKQMIALDQQYMDTERVIRITNKEGAFELVNIKPEDIQGDYDLIVEAGATQAMNKQVKRAEALQLFSTLAPFLGSIIKPDWMVKHLLETYDIKDIDEAFVQQQPQQPQPFGTPAGQTASTPLEQVSPTAELPQSSQGITQ